MALANGPVQLPLLRQCETESSDHAASHHCVVVVGDWTMQWEQLPGSASAPACIQHTTCYHAASRRAVLFGGYATTQGCLNSLHIVDLDTKECWQPEHHGDFPKQRRGHVAEIIGDCMWVFGGSEDFACALCDMFCLKLGTWEWLEVRAGERLEA